MTQPHSSGHPEQLTDGDFSAVRDPFALFDSWLSDAVHSEVNDPNAMSLATVDDNGLPNARIVLLKGVDERGFVFYTNTESAKGRELAAHPKAALIFHWKSLRRQVRVRGLVERVSDAEADAYYSTRPRGSRIGAWASQQSRPLPERRVLEEAVRAFEDKYPGEDIPRPPHWSGFRIVPLAMEFWHDRPYRLHDRLVFERANATEIWRIFRLYP